MTFISNVVRGANSLYEKAKDLVDLNKTEVGIGGFTFFAKVSDNLNLTSKSPDLALEDGTIVQDNINNDPITLSISGVIGDLELKSSLTNDVIKKISTSLGSYPEFTSSKTASQINQMERVASNLLTKANVIDRYLTIGNQLYQASGYDNNSINTVFNNLGITDVNSKQAQFIKFIHDIHFKKQLISIELPYASYKNMHLTNISVSTTNVDNFYNFKIDAKQLVFVENLYTDINQIFKNPAPAFKEDTKTVVNKGVQAGKKIESSILFNILRG